MGTSVTVESAADELAVGETEEVLTPSPAEQEPSSEPTEPEEETEETTELPEKAPEPEETFEKKVNRLAQSKADKSLVPLQKNNERLTAENESLNARLNDKIWDNAIKSIFDEESESLGEEEATKKMEIRKEAKKQALEFQKNAPEVARTMALLGKVNLGTFLKDMSEYHPVKTLEEAVTFLNNVARHQLVSNKLRPLFFPEEKKDVDAYNEALKKFDVAQDENDVEIIFEGIREAMKGKTPKFVPDSSIQGGGGQVDLSKLSTEDRLTRALKKMDKQK